jgi:hypothetical protein
MWEKNMLSQEHKIMIYIKQKIVQRKWLNYITLHIDVDQTKGNVLYHMCLHLQIEGLWKLHSSLP